MQNDLQNENETVLIENMHIDHRENVPLEFVGQNACRVLGSPPVSETRVIRSTLASRIEAVLFLSQEPVSGRRLVLLAESPEGTKIRAMIKNLNARYDEQSRAFRVYEVAGGFQLRTRPPFVPWLARLQQVPIEIRLSIPALETLAIIAYQQPVLRATIEKIRGVQCGELLRQLMEQDLAKIVGKSDDLGRPFFYGTTKRFLQVFGLNRTEELS